MVPEVEYLILGPTWQLFGDHLEQGFVFVGVTVERTGRVFADGGQHVASHRRNDQRAIEPPMDGPQGRPSNLS
jgi:hypothetical protein